MNYAATTKSPELLGTETTQTDRTPEARAEQTSPCGHLAEPWELASPVSTRVRGMGQGGWVRLPGCDWGEGGRGCPAGAPSEASRASGSGRAVWTQHGRKEFTQRSSCCAPASTLCCAQRLFSPVH